MGNVFKKKSNKSDKSKKGKNDKQTLVKKVTNDVIFNRIITNIATLKVYEVDDTAEFETKELRDLLLSIDDAFFSHKKVHDQLTDILLQHEYLETVYPFLHHYAEQGFTTRKEVNLPATNILNTLWSATSESFEFRKHVGETGYLMLLLCKLSDNEFTQLMDINDRVQYIVQSILAIFHNISRSAELKDLLRETKAINTVKRFTTANSPEIKALAYMFIANVATNEDDVSVVDTTGTIPFLVEILNEAMKTKDKVFCGENAKFPAHVIIESLHKLAVEDANRVKIFECNGVKTLLDILRSLNVMKKEQSASANAIWMLCYNEKIKHYVKTQKECYDSIIKLAEASVHEELRRSCKGILMLLNNEIEKKAEIYKAKQKSDDLKRLRPLLNRQQATDVEVEQSTGHIMISYNKLSRDICMKIKEKLEQYFDTWMDVDCIYGDALDSMADAVEKASVVLICMTESYKESANCAIEAKYTLALKKPYVPLRLQSKYVPRGWLGMLLNYKIFIDFVDKPFEDSFKLLLKEINCVLAQNRNSSQSSNNTSASTSTGGGSTSINSMRNQFLSKTSNSTSIQSQNKGSFQSTSGTSPKQTLDIIPKSDSQNTNTNSLSSIGYQWNNQQILDWLDQIHLEAYRDKFKDYDGKRLHRLFCWKMRESHLYYNFISETFESESKQSSRTTDILIFEEELEKLFS